MALVRFSFKIDEELKKELMETSNIMGDNISEKLREFVKAYVDSNKDTAKKIKELKKNRSTKL